MLKPDTFSESTLPQYIIDCEHPGQYLNLKTYSKIDRANSKRYDFLIAGDKRESLPHRDRGKMIYYITKLDEKENKLHLHRFTPKKESEIYEA